MRRTLFMHIPKTAGMSVLVHMRNVYAAKERLELRWQDNTLQTVKAEDVSKADFIWLHEPLSQLSFSTNDFFKFTFLRNPTDRIFSLFTYLRDPLVIDAQDFSHTPSYVVNSLKEIEKMSFDDFIISEDPVHQGHTSNIYTTYFMNGSDVNLNNKKECLERCIKYMERQFDYIGTTQTLAEDMLAIKRACFPCCEHEFSSKKINVSKKENVDFSLSEKASDVLNNKIELDIKIYKHACRLQKKLNRKYGKDSFLKRILSK